MNPFDKNLNCQDVGPLLVFYVCDEVSEKERRQVESHLGICDACTSQLTEERKLQETMIGAWQPADELDASGILLAQCRSELAEALDDLSAPSVRESWRPFGWLWRWMALRPAWSGAALVLLGVLLGTQVIPLFQHKNNNDPNPQAVKVMPTPRLTLDQLDKMSLSGVNFSPASSSTPGTVQLQLSAEQPLEISGNVDDTDMRQVLTYVVENGERFDPGVRIDCLDALRPGVRDQAVRHALITAARKDQNPAVRMKALESLRSVADDDGVRQLLLDALKQDSNPGVRVEAVNMLVGSLKHDSSNSPGSMPGVPPAPPALGPLSVENDPSVERVVRALEELQRRDPSRYVRLRSAAALRQIGPREVQ